MKLSELLKSELYCSATNISNINISSITTNVSEIDENTLFVFLKSIKFDINKIITTVLNKQPAAIICEDDLEIKSDSVPIITSKNTRRLLAFIYSRFYEIDYEKTKFIAVTGTNGKTTTATMLTHILSHSGKKVGFIGTGKILIDGQLITETSYTMTTPDPVYLYSVIKEMQNYGCKYIVMEVSSHALYFEKVAPIPFYISIFTNLSSEHLDFHSSIDEYYNVKMRLFEQTKFGIFNLDDAYSRKAYETASCKKASVGIINKADSVADNIKINRLYGSEYIYREKNRLFKINLAIGGDYNIYNSLMATQAALRLGISTANIKSAYNTLKSIDGRFEIIENDITVIIDYAHTEFAFENLLRFLFSIKNQEQKLICVFGCGGERDKLKRPKMAAAAEKYSDFVIVTSDNSRSESEIEIIQDILQGFKDTSNRVVITSRDSAIEYAILSAKSNDIVAIIGKGHERYNYDKNGVHYFDERKCINKAFRKRRGNK
ncbi:MAG: UDP-N-acetylmuramoyl-L-alanyl-D-glutamate--2,6-diaminopimelate ligase [Ruminococcaceae bacterium]|nr:UDP-N-acetylmuramoyl-L-alanyl-D-glutamate--2,6-diaminopimelate ligase [Oscillospiraceae bacterium]